jgi:hypothetical protein
LGFQAPGRGFNPSIDALSQKNQVDGALDGPRQSEKIEIGDYCERVNIQNV